MTDPKAQAAWVIARTRLQAFALGLKSLGIDRAGLPKAEHRALTEALREGLRATNSELEVSGFEAPHTLEEWEHLARIVEMPFETIRSGDFTLADAHAFALAWADRQRMKARPAAEDGGSTTHSPLRIQPDAEIQPAVTSNQLAIMRTLVVFDPAELVSVARIGKAMERRERLSDRTIGVALLRLIELGLVDRPEGPRRGARLTIPGRQVVRKIAD